MSIKEAKDQAAREYAYDDWEDLIFFNSMTANIEHYIDRALEIYGDAQWNAAIEKAADADIEFDQHGCYDHGSMCNEPTIYKQSILKLKKP